MSDIRQIPRWMGALPLWVFLGVYLVTCFLAAVPLAFDYQPLRILVGYFAGVFLPTGFDPGHAGRFWALLVGAPVLMALAYHLAHGVGRRRWPPAAPPRLPAADSLGIMASLVFMLSASVAVNSLIRTNALGDMESWWDYGAWVLVRWSLFSQLGFFEFVNLYMWLPLSAAWMVVTARGLSPRAWWSVGAALVLALFVTFLLFQKKALIAMLLLVLFTVALERAVTGHWSRWANRAVLAALTGLVFIYLAMTVLPVWRETTTRLDEAEQMLKKGQRPKAQQDPLVTTEELVAFLGERRAAHVAAYALLSPFTRTSLPAFYYAEVFPRQHPYFGLDLGQDILGIGRMPEDNRVVWAAMYPELPGGTTSAPFQFVLYSQVGLVGALVGVAAVGAAMGLAWAGLLGWRRAGAVRPVLGSLLLLLAVYLAIDSPRNSLMASYGVLWGAVFVAALFGLETLVARWTARARIFTR